MAERIANWMGREGFRVRLLMLFCAVTLLIISLFILFRVVEGGYQQATIDAVIVIVIAGMAARVWLTQRIGHAGLLLMLFLTIAVVGLVYMRGYPLLLWMYPLVLANAFILERWRSYALNGLAMLAMLPLYPRHDPQEFLLFLFSLLMSILFADTIARVTDGRLQLALREKSRHLQERIKELACINDVTAILTRPELSLHETLERIVRVLPPAWQYPEITVARITLHEKEFRTTDFRETPWLQRQEIRAGGESVGAVEVYYLETRPEADEGVFLKEERDLINLVTNRIGQAIERERAHETLHAYAARLKHYTQDLERFAFAASHDLREPLRSVVSYSQLLTRKYRHDDAKADEYLHHITGAVHQMQELIEGLRRYVSLPLQPPKLDPTALDAPLDQALTRLRGLIEESNATVEREDLPALPIEPTQMAQMFQCLIENAIRFRSEAPPVIHVSAVCDKRQCTVSVRDNGIGIDTTHAERIFELYTRLHDRRAYPGNGIGLAIARRIVELHGGRIWVEPTDDGSVFRFTLPTDPNAFANGARMAGS